MGRWVGRWFVRLLVIVLLFPLSFLWRCIVRRYGLRYGYEYGWMAVFDKAEYNKYPAEATYCSGGRGLVASTCYRGLIAAHREESSTVRHDVGDASADPWSTLEYPRYSESSRFFILFPFRNVNVFNSGFFFGFSLLNSIYILPRFSSSPSPHVLLAFLVLTLCAHQGLRRARHYLDFLCVINPPPY